MKLYSEDKNYKIYQGSMLDMLEVIDKNSIDSIICDPPYELNFMNKGWGNSGIAFKKETWQKCFEVLKSGGYLLAFGGTRTFHRIACAIEDAGFEIRDTIMWLYGSGFPKSLNIGLAIDKRNGCKDRGHRIAVANRYHPDGTLEPNGEILEPYECKTEEGKKWQGWGTALKPAYEPIIVARKPCEGSTTDNVLKYGVGGINIDECRIYGDESINCHNTQKGTFAGKVQTAPKMSKDNDGIFKGRNAERITYIQHEGRFPSNVILTYDENDKEEVCGGFPNSKGMSSQNNYSNEHIYRGQSFQESKTSLNGFREWYNDEGSAARYFYCAKASKKDRDDGLCEFEEKNMRLEQNREIHSAGCEYEENGKIKQNPHLQSSIKRNIHPTVKPIELMQYLVRLVTPAGGVVLDCFLGSGSTGKATMFENRERNTNYKFIGIELTEEYLPIAKARIDYAIYTFEYELKQEKIKTGQLSIFDFAEGDIL